MITHVCFIAVTLAGSLGRCLNTRPAAPCSNNVFGTWQMLMHKKTCVIPIMDYLIFIISVCMRKSISMRDFPRPSKGLNIGPFLISPPPPPPPPPPQTGYIVFGADPVGVRFISVHYLLNQLMDFGQTCIDTLLGEGGELIRFWCP